MPDINPWSATLEYRDFRPPYLPEFFLKAAAALGLSGKEPLLDLGCGTGELTLGFAPWAGSITGVDAEQPMLDAAARRAREMGYRIRLVHSRVQDAPLDLGRFHAITLGRSHWYMRSPKTFKRMEQWLLPAGRILICSTIKQLESSKWHDDYHAIRRRWSREPSRKRARFQAHEFFRGTHFVQDGIVRVFGEQSIDLEHLVKRALGSPGTTRAALGERTDGMISELRSKLAPYFEGGPLVETLETAGLLFRRRRG